MPTQFGTPLRVATEHAEQMRVLAKARDVSLNAAFGLMAEHCAATGMPDFPVALPGIAITVSAGNVAVKIDGATLRTMTPDETHDLAEGLRIRDGRATLYTDGKNWIEISRRGRGIAIRIRRGDAIIVNKPFSPCVAEAIAKRLDSASVLAEALTPKAAAA